MSARDALDDIIEDIAFGVGPTPDDARDKIDAFAAETVVAELRSFAAELAEIARSEGFNADPARRRAFAEIIAMARTRAGDPVVDLPQHI